MAKKNILFITSDQQHWNTIGKFNPEIKTPNLDRLCNEGCCYQRCYTVNPTCTPTRATFLTGMMPSQHGAWTLGTKLPEEVHTITEDFRNAGYRSALIGKAHFQPLAGTEKYPSLEAYPILQDLDFWKNYDGRFYGFDHVELARNHTNEAHIGQHYALWLQENGCHNWRDYFKKPTGYMDSSDGLVWEIPEKYHYDTWIAERSCSMLEEYKKEGENFFLWSSFFDPHPAYLVPEPWASMYDPEKITLPQISPEESGLLSPFVQMSRQEHPDISPYSVTGYYLHGVKSHLHDDAVLRRQIAIYYGMISMMDHYIGVILDKLEELDLMKDTVIVFTTDHGHLFGQHGLIAKGPFLYDDLLRVPFLVRHPDEQNPGRVNTSVQSLLDVPCTLLDCCDIPRPDGMAGVSAKEVWTGKKDAVRSRAMVEFNHEAGTINMRAVVNERYKLIVYAGSDFGELYDLQQDPDENHNLWNVTGYEQVQAQMYFEFIQSTMETEQVFMPRIASA